MAESHRPETGHPEIDYERRDVNFGPIFRFGAGLVVLILVAGLAMALLYQQFAGRYGPVPAPPADLPPAPPVMRELQQMRAQEEEILTTYGPHPVEENVVRIPIERAKELILEEGLPVVEEESPPDQRPATPPEPPEPPEPQEPQEPQAPQEPPENRKPLLENERDANSET